MEFIPSQRGGKLLALDGYILRVDKKLKNGCTSYKCQTCPSRGVLNAEETTFTPGPVQHNHAPDFGRIDILRRRAELKKNVLEQPTTSMKRLYQDAFADVQDDDGMVSVPPFKSLKSGLYHERLKRLPKLPTTSAEIHLVDQWRHTNSGADFVLVEDGADDKIIAFGTSANLRLLSEATTYFMDGTFHVAPSQFYQLFIIHVFKFDCMIPVVYALLPNKQPATYKRLFNLLKLKGQQLGMPLTPDVIQSDFEQAIHIAVSDCFQFQRIRGCHFHFTQCIWRKVQKLGLTVRYKTDELVGKIVRRALGLPFLPLHLIEDVWTEAIGLVAPEDVQLSQFLDYVTVTFVDELHAVFPKEIWTQSDNLGTDTQRSVRTNNHLESLHGKLKGIFHKHPNIYRFVELIREEQAAHELTLRLLRAGTDPRVKQRRMYKQATQQLIRLRELLESGDLTSWEFCGRCAAVTTAQK